MQSFLVIPTHAAMPFGGSTPSNPFGVSCRLSLRGATHMWKFMNPYFTCFLYIYALKSPCRSTYVPTYTVPPYMFPHGSDLPCVDFRRHMMNRHHTIQCSRLSSSIIRHKGATVIEGSRAQMCDVYTGTFDGCLTNLSAAWAKQFAVLVRCCPWPD